MCRQHSSVRGAFSKQSDLHLHKSSERRHQFCYSSNICYASGMRVSQVYGALKRSAKKAKGGAKLSTIEAAVLGSGASLAAQAVTTPLDVVRTRVMTASPSDEEYEGDDAVCVMTDRFPRCIRSTDQS